MLCNKLFSAVIYTLSIKTQSVHVAYPVGSQEEAPSPGTVTDPPSVLDAVRGYSVVSDTSSPPPPITPALRTNATANVIGTILFLTFSPPFKPLD
jgi:hypothetical protein